MAWQKELDRSVETFDDLLKYGNFPEQDVAKLRKVVEKHPICITRYYMSLIDFDDPDDPIRKMAFPSVEELNVTGSYDTSGERDNTKMSGLQHKYSQTALVLATTRCAMYCRHCFRKRLVGLSSPEIVKRFNTAVKYIKSHKEINNVLISGGDPLVLPTKTIMTMLDKLAPINHLDFVRIGSRTLVTFPQRLLDRSDNLVGMLKKYSATQKQLCIVTQFNHPREITEQSTKAVKKLLQAGILLNNQTVLLKGVNDNPSVLADLMNKLVRIGMNPYYLFQCRPVKRVKHHFQVPFKQGCEIVEKTRSQLNGISKRFKFAMSHKTGKIEIIGIMGNDIYLKYHQAKSPKNFGRFMKYKLPETAGWLDDLK